jgi:hypothetical protein
MPERTTWKLSPPIEIRPEIRGWIDSDPEFRRLKTNPDFIGKLDTPVAADALSNIGSAAVPALIEALKEQNVDVHQSAANALSNIGPAAADAVPALHPRDGVFISYAHKDDQLWLDTLLSNLSWLQRKHGIEIWTDRDIAPGAKWHETIQSAIDRAKVAVLLVSPEFLASPYIINNELAKMLQAAESDGMTIFWIPVRPSAYRHSPIGAFQAAQPPDRPLSSLRGARRDQAFVDIVEKLAKALGLAADVSSASDVVGVKSRAQAEAAIKTILDDCYRRALFTRMHAQQDVDAMFASIDQCRISVQKNIPGIHRKDLQDTAVELLATVEQIERRKPIRGPDDVSAINKLKLAALHLFRVLAKATDRSYPLPETGKLGEAAFFTQQEADAPLSLDDLRSQTAINPTSGEVGA